MPRFARMLADGMAKRGHTVDIWAPKAKYFKLSTHPFIQKWLGYIDQYIIFPGEIRRKVKHCPSDTIFVFTDQALGPWVPSLARFPHVIHCHDFMALHSAMGKLPENPTSWTGRQYQQLIRRGFSKGKHFISVSHKTREDLHLALIKPPLSSDVVYNGFNQAFVRRDAAIARELFGKRIKMDLSSGFILHVGGNYWYKNRGGVIEIYSAWRAGGGSGIPLLMVGDAPNKELLMKHGASAYASDIHWLSGVEDEFVRLAYAGASLFLFPSFGEGFGWPIAEAMASGCPVITTGEAPMTEVAGDNALLIRRRPLSQIDAEAWAIEGASLIDKILALSVSEREAVIQKGINNAKRFDTALALDEIEKIYLKILSGS